MTLKGHAIGRYDVGGAEVRIGRHPDNDVHIESLAVSRFHCALRRGDDGGWRVEDLGSNNGTYVNGARVESDRSVRDGDTLGVGQFQVSLRTEGGPSASDAGEVTIGLASSPEVREQACPHRAFLVLENRSGPPVPVERDVFQLGAAPGLDVEVAGPPKRAVIVRGYGGFQVLSVGPPGEVTLNGAPVPDRAWLPDGAAVTVGELRFTFYLGQPAEEQNTIQFRRPDAT